MRFFNVVCAVLGLTQTAQSAALISTTRSETDLGKRAIHKMPGGTVDCWDFQGRFPDEWHGTIDGLMNDVRGSLQKSPGGLQRNSVDWRFSGVVLFYWCQAGPTAGDGELTFDDFEEAIYWMDQKCGPYYPGYFRWAGSDEIVGRARNDMNLGLCQG